MVEVKGEPKRKVLDPDERYHIETCHFCHVKMLPSHALNFRVRVTELSGTDRGDFVFMVTTCKKCKSYMVPVAKAFASRKIPDNEAVERGW